MTHTFRPIFDMTTFEAAAYAENPALKVPVLNTPDGPLFGTENICRELVGARRQARESSCAAMFRIVSSRTPRS